MADTKKKTEVTNIERILDPRNNEQIVLYAADSSEIRFDQVALVPIGEGDKSKLYSILKPLTKIDGIKANEAIVFAIIVDQKTDQFYLAPEEDQAVVDEVFKKYMALFEEAQKEFAKKVQDEKK